MIVPRDTLNKLPSICILNRGNNTTDSATHSFNDTQIQSKNIVDSSQKSLQSNILTQNSVHPHQANIGKDLNSSNINENILHQPEHPPIMPPFTHHPQPGFIHQIPPLQHGVPQPYFPLPRPPPLPLHHLGQIHPPPNFPSPPNILPLGIQQPQHLPRPPGIPVYPQTQNLYQIPPLPLPHHSFQNFQVQPQLDSGINVGNSGNFLESQIQGNLAVMSDQHVYRDGINVGKRYFELPAGVMMYVMKKEGIKRKYDAVSVEKVEDPKILDEIKESGDTAELEDALERYSLGIRQIFKEGEFDYEKEEENKQEKIALDHNGWEVGFSEYLKLDGISTSEDEETSSEDSESDSSKEFETEKDNKKAVGIPYDYGLSKTENSINDLENELAKPMDINKSIPGNNKGFKLLQKMGWQQGQSLGQTFEGISEPITHKSQVLSEQNNENENNSDLYSTYRKQMSKGYGKTFRTKKQ
ncbi:hypothetical protein BB559_001776 [Furculomyces boomerangus]|uniref:G-patch domain-containing protein n=2 Tax=Harpellales TaxID=61421 RepID=A0A2T9Z0K0_9FUNG|nr:hypothetical protein BB559_001776 [Furculomyces boomerangus]PVZ99271.1 hypothetical protein BB558_004718 [Smittium angustum]